MNCVYTGARVYFPGYGVTVSADLYRVENVIIVRWTSGSEVWDHFTEDTRTVDKTHEVDLTTDTDWACKDHWWRQDLAIAVIPMNALIGELR